VRIDKNATHKKLIDPVTPVRGAAVRGQLRFWWRATHGCLCSTVEEMRKREGALWGTSSSAGKVSLTITAQGEPKAPEGVGVYDLNDKGRSVPKSGMREVAYGAFPLQAATGAAEKEPGSLSGLANAYTVTVRTPSAARSEVEDTLLAWLLFGAIGGRSRRGFGAVHCAELSVEPQAFLKRFSSERSLAGVPSLRGAKVAIKDGGPNAEAAWKVALGRMQTFRQGPGIGRNTGQEAMRPGRSRWPEPELIRTKTGRRLPKHQPILSPPKAPRAMFGLPIIVHFKDQDRGEPRDTKFVPVPLGELKRTQQDRMASPLILKPIKSGNSWKAACLLLADPGRSDMKVELEDDTKRPRPVEWKLTAAEAEQMKPLEGLGSADVLLAFLNFFAK
jgi:CRISPR-associated protein Cmr1